MMHARFRTLVGVSLVVTVMLPLVVSLVIVHVMDGRSNPDRTPAEKDDNPYQVTACRRVSLNMDNICNSRGGVYVDVCVCVCMYVCVCACASVLPGPLLGAQ